MFLGEIVVKAELCDGMILSDSFGGVIGINTGWVIVDSVFFVELHGADFPFLRMDFTDGDVFSDVSKCWPRVGLLGTRYFWKSTL
jgi:hypothetical protein